MRQPCPQQPRLTPDLHTVKLSVRLSVTDSEALALQAKVLGISQARVVALLVRGAELPTTAAPTVTVGKRCIDGDVLGRFRHRVDTVLRLHQPVD